MHFDSKMKGITKSLKNNLTCQNVDKIISVFSCGLFPQEDLQKSDIFQSKVSASVKMRNSTHEMADFSKSLGGNKPQENTERTMSQRIHSSSI